MNKGETLEQIKSWCDDAERYQYRHGLPAREVRFLLNLLASPEQPQSKCDVCNERPKVRHARMHGIEVGVCDECGGTA